jgi:flavin reductase (DIM6/NTAB) family NADH-FMN oxidoreductase RutF|tara:strand:- start:49 stop:660 length:612 start_codon:yes stop_codon:yes gene_type:complete
MQSFKKTDINKMSKIYRLNLINSITGYKSANLIGTKTNDNINNVAVFSSVIHLGSNPPLIGFILRPTTVPRHTYENIHKYGCFTLNQISKSQIKSAHQTSAKYPKENSEFKETGLKYDFKDGIEAPFVKNSPIQVGCSYINEYDIKENNTIFIIGKIEAIYVNKNLLLDDGLVQLDKGGIVAINGLDAYALPKLIERFSYARP